MNVLQRIDKLIGDLDSEVQAKTKALEYLRAVRAEIARTASGAASDTEPSLRLPLDEDAADSSEGKSEQLAPFTRRYRKTAEDYVLELLGSMPGNSLSVTETWKILKDQGREYTRQAVDMALRGLVDDGKAERVNAPKKAAHKYQYRIARGDQDV